MSYPPNFDGYPPYGNQPQQPPYPGSQPGVGFSPYPTDDGARGGMPQFPGQSNFGGGNITTSNMPGFGSMPQPQYGYSPSAGVDPGYPSGGGGGGAPYQSYNNASNQPFSNTNFPPYGQSSVAGGSSGPQHHHHQPQQQQQSYQPFTGNSMTSSSSSSYGQSSNTQQPLNSFQSQQQYPNLPNSSFSSNANSSMSSNYGSGGGGADFVMAHEPTVRPSPNFNPQNDAELVHKAMKGFGTDEKGLVKILCHRTGQERALIAKMYKQMYGKELVEALRGELSGKFESLMVALATPAEFYDAEGIYRAIEGIGTDEDSLVEILCTRSNSEIAALKAAYKYRYNRNIEHDIKGDTSGHFERLLVSLLNGGRDESTQVDRNRAAQTAQELLKRGEKMFGTDESYFNSVLAAQSLPQLRAVFDEYRRVSGKDLEKSIASEMSGDLRMGMVSLVKCIRNPAEFFAEHLYKSMRGMGTNDHVLVRVLVTRCDKDLGAVKREFHRMNNQPLETMIKGDTSGDYEHGLIALCGSA